jgi:hypothetical protein
LGLALLFRKKSARGKHSSLVSNEEKKFLLLSLDEGTSEKLLQLLLSLHPSGQKVSLLQPRAKCYKTFYVRNLQLSVIITVLVPGRPFLSILIAGVAGAYSSEAPFSCLTLE